MGRDPFQARMFGDPCALRKGLGPARAAIGAAPGRALTFEAVRDPISFVHGVSMFTVRKEQMEALSEVYRADFEARMVAHLHGCPLGDACRAMGEPALRELIRHGVARAAAHGIVTERGASVYVDVMVAFGRDFDVDPALPWAAEALSDQLPATSFERAERLFRAAFERGGGE